MAGSSCSLNKFNILTVYKTRHIQIKHCLGHIQNFSGETVFLAHELFKQKVNVKFTVASFSLFQQFYDLYEEIVNCAEKDCERKFIINY
jgi:polyisoprenoid-binding protein YceI